MFCRGCEYDLAGIETLCCPECGRPFDPVDASTFTRLPGQLGRGARHAILAACAAGVVLPVLALLRADPPFLILPAAAGPGILASIPVMAGLTLWPMRTSPWWISLAVLPSAVVLILYYSLVVHMHLTLGGWPTSIGMSGFPAGLRLHADLALASWNVVLAANLLLWPIAVIICAAVPRWRRAVLPVGLYAVAHAICVGLMFLGPAGFISWWLD